MSDHTIEEVFSAGENPALKLSNIAGHVTITGAMTSEIRVEARKHNDGDAANTKIHIEQKADGCVEVKVEYEQGLLDGLLSRKFCSVDFDIQVPHNCKVDASVVSADLEALHLEGGLSFSSVSGEMELEDLKGDLSISTVSGDVEASDLHGKLHLNTVSGDVSVDDSELPGLRLSTVSADVSLDTGIAPEGSYHLSSVSGNIDWRVPENTSCRFHSSTLSGHITIDAAGVTQRTKDGKHRSLTLGSGGPDIHLSSVSGNLRVHTTLVAPAVI